MHDMLLAYWGMNLYHWWHRIRLARIQEHHTRARMVGIAGASQLGGLRDPRCAVVALMENGCRRRAMGLPSCDLVADAMHGFDGGRHSKYLEAAADAGVGTKDWLITAAIMRKHKCGPASVAKKESSASFAP